MLPEYLPAFPASRLIKTAFVPRRYTEAEKSTERHATDAAGSTVNLHLAASLALHQVSSAPIAELAPVDSEASGSTPAASPTRIGGSNRYNPASGVSPNSHPSKPKVMMGDAKAFAKSSTTTTARTAAACVTPAHAGRSFDIVQEAIRESVVVSEPIIAPAVDLTTLFLDVEDMRARKSLLAELVSTMALGEASLNLRQRTSQSRKRPERSILGYSPSDKEKPKLGAASFRKKSRVGT